MPAEFAKVEVKLDYEKAVAAWKAGELPEGVDHRPGALGGSVLR